MIMDHSGSHATLPAELILAIIDKVDADEDLLVLATGSRYFHEVSMSAYFARNNFDPSPDEITFTPSEDSMKLLSGLAVYLGSVGASVGRLSYDFGYSKHTEELIKEVRLLTRYVEKLSRIDKVSLRLAISFSGDPNEWQTGSTVLLKTIMERSCKSINVITSQLSSFYEEPRSLRRPKPSDWLQGYWPEGHEPATGAPRLLKEFVIQTFPTFLRPFYYHTLKANASSLTSINFKNIFRGGSDWASMMGDLHFPRLTHLSVVYGVIPRSPFVKFLASHRMIQDFKYHHIRYEPKPRYLGARINKDVFEHLQSVTTTPEHILNFLPLMDRLLALTTIAIQVEEHVTNFSALEGALRCLVSCANKITLSLEVTLTGLGFGAWLTTIIRKGLKSRPEPLLQCVETLSLDNGDWGFNEELTGLLPVWIRLFPALRALILRGRFFRSPSIAAGTNLETLKDACPGVYIEWNDRSSVQA